MTSDGVVCLDFARAAVWLAPVCCFLAALVKGLSGMGEAIVFTAIWQLAFIAGVEETSDLGLLAALICLQQCVSTVSMAMYDHKAWRFYVLLGGVFSVAMMCLSPLGNHVRETAPTEAIRMSLAIVFLAFALLKIVAEGVRDVVQCSAARADPAGSRCPLDEEGEGGVPSVPAAVVGVPGHQQPALDLEGACAPDSRRPGPVAPDLEIHDDCNVRLGRQPCAGQEELCVLKVLKGGGEFYLWHGCSHARDPVQTQLRPYPTLDAAILGFEETFMGMTSHRWADRQNFKPISGWNIMAVGTESPAAASQAAKAAGPEQRPPAMPRAPRWLLPVLPVIGALGGFLGGLCGMNGPPFILTAAFGGLDKSIARSVFPMGQLPEVWFIRLPQLLVLGHIKSTDAHIYLIGFVAGQFGLFLGSRGKSLISQAVFEYCILSFLILSSLTILGLLEGHPRAVWSVGAVALVLCLRVGQQLWAVWKRKAL